MKNYLANRRLQAAPVPHSDFARINGNVTGLARFATAFGCKAGQR